MRSLATRGAAHRATSEALVASIAAAKAEGYDLVIVETAGIGQSDSEIADLVDLAMYVMTPEYGAASQLEKIDMLDFADMVVLNKADKRGAEDALRDVRKQYQRAHKRFNEAADDMPVYATCASQFNDPATNWLFVNLVTALAAKTGLDWTPKLAAEAGNPPPVRHHPARAGALPGRDRRHRAGLQSLGPPPGRDRRTGPRPLDEPPDFGRQGAFRRGLLRLGPPRRGGRGRSGCRHPPAPAALPGTPGRTARRKPPPHPRLDRAEAQLHGARERLRGARQGDPHGQLHRVPQRVSGAQGGPAAVRGLGRTAPLAAAGEPAGPLPLHGRRLRVQARRRGSHPHVRGRRHARSAPTNASTT